MVAKLNLNDTDAATPAGAWNFTTTPTVNGSPLGGEAGALHITGTETKTGSLFIVPAAVGDIGLKVSAKTGQTADVFTVTAADGSTNWLRVGSAGTVYAVGTVNAVTFSGQYVSASTGIFAGTIYDSTGAIALTITATEFQFPKTRFLGQVGFFNTAPVSKPTGVAVDSAGIHAALVTLGLIAA